MIYETLQILKEQLDKYLIDEGMGKIVVLENIALWESGSIDAAKIENKVVLTLLKMEEETTLRNVPNFKVTAGKTEYKNPPVHLNLYLIISANCETYDKSLRSISKTIQFFQGKKIFTSTNTVYNRTNVAFDLLDHFKFVVELFTPGFEELNHIWGTLGGRQMPAVIYRIQLIKLERDKKLSGAPAITNISGTLNDTE